MTDFLEFDPAAAYRLAHDRLPATSWFALSSLAVDDFIDAGYATGTANGPRSLALGLGEITGTGYGRQSQSTPAGVGETTTFAQLTWDTGTATDWRNPKSLVLCTSADNKGYAIAVWNLTPGGAAVDLSSAHVTVSITPVVSPPSSGGSGSPGSPIIRKFPFAFDTPGLVTGHTVYTPAVDEILFDAWFEIDTAWNGTTPQGDVGCFLNGNNSGWFGSVLNQAVDMTVADVANAAAGWLPAELLSSPALPPPHSGSVSGLMAQVIFRAIASQNDFAPDRILPAKFAVNNPVKIFVSTTGALTDPDPGSTQGAAILYLVTATPV